MFNCNAIQHLEFFAILYGIMKIMISAAHVIDILIIINTMIVITYNQ